MATRKPKPKPKNKKPNKATKGKKATSKRGITVPADLVAHSKAVLRDAKADLKAVESDYKASDRETMRLWKIVQKAERAVDKATDNLVRAEEKARRAKGSKGAAPKQAARNAPTWKPPARKRAGRRDEEE